MTQVFYQPDIPQPGTPVLAEEVQQNFEVLNNASALFATEQVSPDLTVEVSGGIYYVGGIKRSIVTTSSPAVDVVSGGSASQQCIALLSVDAGGTLSWAYGSWVTSPTLPVAPFCPSNEIPICEVLVTYNMSTITSSLITDVRPALTLGGGGSGSSSLQLAYEGGQVINESAFGIPISIVQTNAGSGNNVIEITNSGSGYDITGNGSNWYIDKDGNAVFNQITANGASEALVVNQTTTSDAIVVNNQDDGRAINITQSGTATTDVVTIQNLSPGHGINILQDGQLGVNKSGLVVTSTIAQTNGNLIQVTHAHTGSTVPALGIYNAGSGPGLQVTQDNELGVANFGIYFQNQVAQTISPYVKIYNNHTGSTTDSLLIENVGSGTSLNITQRGVLGSGKYSLGITSSDSAQVNSPLVKIQQQHTGSTTAALEITNSGSGAALTTLGGRVSLGATNSSYGADLTVASSNVNQTTLALYLNTASLSSNVNLSFNRNLAYPFGAGALANFEVVPTQLSPSKGAMKCQVSVGDALSTAWTVTDALRFGVGTDTPDGRVGIYTSSTGTDPDAIGLYIRNSGTNHGMVVYCPDSSAREAVVIHNNGTGSALSIQNSSSSIGLYVYHYEPSGYAQQIDVESSATGLYIRNITNSNANLVDILSKTTSNALKIECQANGRGIDITSSATNNPLLSLSADVGNARGDIAFGVSRTSDSSAPSEGDFWYNSTDNVFKYYDGSTVQTLGTGSGGGSLQDAYDVGSTISGTNAIDITQSSPSIVSALTITQNNTDNSANVITVAGSGGGYGLYVRQSTAVGDGVFVDLGTTYSNNAGIGLNVNSRSTTNASGPLLVLTKGYTTPFSGNDSVVLLKQSSAGGTQPIVKIEEEGLGNSTYGIIDIVATRAGNQATGIRIHHSASTAAASATTSAQAILIDFQSSKSGSPIIEVNNTRYASPRSSLEINSSSTGTAGTIYVNQMGDGAAVVLNQTNTLATNHIITVANGGTGADISLNGILIKTGTGSPESTYIAPVGSMFLRTDGGAGTTLYIKETGSGNTGWAAK